MAAIRTFFEKYHMQIGITGIAGLGFYILTRSSKHSDKTGFHLLDTDPSLRKVEKDVLIPKYMRDYSRTESCAEQVKLFNNCVKQYNGGPVFRGAFGSLIGCQDQNKEMMTCMDEDFSNPDIYFMCKKRYMKDKILYATTKVKKPLRKIIQGEIVNNEVNEESQSSEDACQYYKTTKEYYEKFNNINAYDEYILNRYKEKHPEIDL